MTKTQQTEANRYNASPIWAAKKDEATHRAAVRATFSLEADDDWMDEEVTKTQAISHMIASKIATGMNPIEAVKAVCGADKVEAMIDSLYNELRARVA